MSLTYVKDVFHWARSSADISACSVEPGSVEDVGKIVRFILLLPPSDSFRDTLLEREPELKL